MLTLSKCARACVCVCVYIEWLSLHKAKSAASDMLALSKKAEASTIMVEMFTSVRWQRPMHTIRSTWVVPKPVGNVVCRARLVKSLHILIHTVLHN